jgi:hypothetical protein
MNNVEQRKSWIGENRREWLGVLATCVSCCIAAATWFGVVPIRVDAQSQPKDRLIETAPHQQQANVQIPPGKKAPSTKSGSRVAAEDMARAAREAMYSDNMEEFEKWVKAMGDPDTLDKEKTTLMVWAIESGLAAYVSRLLELGADPLNQVNHRLPVTAKAMAELYAHRDPDGKIREMLGVHVARSTASAQR